MLIVLSLCLLGGWGWLWRVLYVYKFGVSTSNHIKLFQIKRIDSCGGLPTGSRVIWGSHFVWILRSPDLEAPNISTSGFKQQNSFSRADFVIFRKHLSAALFCSSLSAGVEGQRIAAIHAGFPQRHPIRAWGCVTLKDVASMMQEKWNDISCTVRDKTGIIWS